MRASKRSQNQLRSKPAKQAVSTPPYECGWKQLLRFSTDPDERNELLQSQQSQETAERGAKTAENIRYGQNVSEQGMGGKTTEAEGAANQGAQLAWSSISNNFELQLTRYCRRSLWLSPSARQFPRRRRDSRGFRLRWWLRRWRLRSGVCLLRS